MAFAAASSWSTSGPTPASTGCGRCPIAAPGPPSTRRPGLTIVGVHTPGVRVRTGPSTISWRRSAHLTCRVPDRHRQRLRGLACLRQPLLAGGLPRRRRRANPLPPLRRRRVRRDRDGDPAAPDGRAARRTSDQDLVDGRARRDSRWPPTGGRCSPPRRTSGTARAPVSRRRTWPASTSPWRYTPPARLPLNHWALAGEWTVAGHAAVTNEPGGTDRVPVPRPRRQPGDGAGDAGNGRPVPGLPRRPAGQGRPGDRRARRWLGARH